MKTEYLKLPVLMGYRSDWIRWLKPEEYIKNYMLDKEIKRVYPNKQTVKMRNDIKDSYKQDNNIKDKDDLNYNEYDKDDEDSRKKRIYKEFFKIVHFKIIIKNPKMLKNSSIKKLD